MCVSILLHLVGFLSSRFTHDARSQEHKVCGLFFGLERCDVELLAAGVRFLLLLPNRVLLLTAKE